MYTSRVCAAFGQAVRYRNQPNPTKAAQHGERSNQQQQEQQRRIYSAMRSMAEAFAQPEAARRSRRQQARAQGTIV